MTSSPNNPNNTRRQRILISLASRFGLRQSLKRRITTILTTLMTLLLILLGTLVTRQSFLNQENLILDQQVATATRAAISIEAFVQRLRSGLTILTRVNHGDIDHANEYIQDLLAVEPAFLEIIIVDLDGNVLTSAARTDDVLGNLFTLQQAQWFLKSAAGSAYLSNLQISPQNEPYTILSQPITNDDNQIEGVVAARVDMRILWDTIAEIPVGQTGLVYVINRSGMLLAHPDANLVLSGVNLSTRPGFETVINTLSGTSFRFIGISNTPAVGGSVTIANTDWQVITELPDAEAFAPTRLATRINIALILLTLILTYAILRFMVNRLSKPIIQLASAAQQFGSGKTTVSFPTYRGPDELGQLVSAFEGMISRVNNFTSELEEVVATRTQELASAGEIGQRITQVRHLDELLPESVELIRKSFDLYHVQIYLKDASGENLVLKASSGEVGRQLLQRGHRLPIDLRSINGTAVFQKRAAVVPDTTRSPYFQPNRLLPRTRSEMAVPLMIGTQVLGSLDLQSTVPQGLNADNLPALNALAGQLAIAIENARLFAETAKARAEVEGYARQMAREGWQEFLDVISQSEQIGYTFDHNDVKALGESPFTPAKYAFSQPIEIVGESVGAIVIESNDLTWTAANTTLVHAVAQQVAQQIESLRLLAETNRYRDEAEQAIRRLTQTGWQQQQAALKRQGFIFDQKRLKPLTSANLQIEDTAVTRKLHVQGAPIGELTVAGATASLPETEALVTAVAQQLAAHIESLRLNAQTQQALSETERQKAELQLINHVVSTVSTTTDLQEAMLFVAEELVKSTGADTCGIALLTESETHLRVIADYRSDPSYPPGMGTVFPVTGNPSSEQVISTRKTLIIDDPQNSPLTTPIHGLMRERQVATLTIIPMVAGNEVIGTVGLDLLTTNEGLTNESIRLAETIVLQATTAANNIRLFEQTQRALAETAMLYEAGAKINEAQSYTDIVNVLRNYTTLGRKAQQVAIDFFNRPWQPNDLPEWFDVLAYNSVRGEKLANGRFFLKDFPEIVNLLHPDSPTLIENITESDLLAPSTRQLYLKQFGSNSTIFIPLTVGGQWLGFVNFLYEEPVVYQEADVRRLMAFSRQVAVSVQTIHLLNETSRLYTQEQARAQREQVLRQIAATIRGSANVELVLKTAAQEIGKTLGRETFIILDPDQKNGASNGKH